MTRQDAKKEMQRAMANYAKTPSATNYGALTTAMLNYQAIVNGYMV